MPTHESPHMARVQLLHWQASLVMARGYTVTAQPDAYTYDLTQNAPVTQGSSITMHGISSRS